MDFLEILASGRYHRDMKILKILASNSKRFTVYGIFKTLQIDDDKGRPPDTTFTAFFFFIPENCVSFSLLVSSLSLSQSA